MKNITGFILLFFCGLYSLSIFPQTGTKAEFIIHKDKNNKEYKWIKEQKKSTSGFDCFYYQVERSMEPDVNGNFTFKIYFLSNSNIGDKRVSTNIDGIKVFFEGEEKPVAEEPYILIKPKSDTFNGKYLGFEVKSKKNDEVIKLVWKNYSAY